MRMIDKLRRAACVVLYLCGALFAGVAQADDRALFWSISRAGEHQGYLLGTIHSEDPRVLDFTTGFLDRLSGNRVFAMELVPDLKTLARLAEYMHLPEGASLADMIGEKRFAAVSGALARYGVPPGQVARMKPWAAMMTLSVPPPETGFFMDFSLSLRASGSGLQVIGLETLEQQLAFLENMPVAQQLLLLDHAVVEFENVQIMHDLMVQTYLESDLEKLSSLAQEQMSTLDAGVRDYFVAEGIDARNHRMLESLLPALEQGGVFTAVGALHLPGESGLLSLLRRDGYELQPLAAPFGAPGGEQADVQQ